MYEKQRQTDFANQIDAEIADLAAQSDLPPNEARARAFTEIVLGYLEENGMVSSPTLYEYNEQSGRGRCRFSGYAFTDDGSTLQIFTTAYQHDATLQNLSNAEISKLAGRATQLYDRSRKHDLAKFTNTPVAFEAAQRIVRELDRIESVEILILSNGIARTRNVNDVEIGEVIVSYEIIDLERLFRSVASGLPRDEIIIDFESLIGRPMPCLEMKPRPSEYETYLVILPGELLFKLYDSYGPRLLEFNVRSFLQARGKVNRGIRDTLRNDPERFMAYNNGIAATADDIEVGLFHGETTIKSIRGLQIVNGGQTTASIHRAKKHEKIDITRVTIAMKLTKVAADRLEEFVPLISRFANTQNAIQVADLSANHKFHIQIERLSESVWCPGQESRWFYERTRGQYQVALSRFGTTLALRRQFKQETPPQQKFAKTDVAKFVMSFECRPHIVSTGAQKNFTIFMTELPNLYGVDWLPDEEYYRELISKGIVFNICAKIVRQEKFPAYRANITTYLTACLAEVGGDEIDLDMIWEEQGLSSELINLLRSWSHAINATIVKSAEGRNITEWCKKEECWETVRNLQLQLPRSGIPEFHGGQADSNGTRKELGQREKTDGERNIELCLALSAQQWFDIHAWGAESGMLNHWEKGVALTLSGYAAEGWVKKPSVKQARLGIRAIQLAQRHRQL